MVKPGTLLIIFLLSLFVIFIFLFFQFGSANKNRTYFAEHNQLKFENNPEKNGFPNLYQRNYTGFTCWISCPDRATVMCHYKGFKDTGNAPRPSSFTYDPMVPRSCQQLSFKSYNLIQNGWDR